MAQSIVNKIIDIQEEIDFSGSILVKEKDKTLIELSYGFANRSEQIENSIHTRYGIASGCKLFTAIAVCQLVEEGLLTFETKLIDCLNIQFPNFDNDINIHHLLTHTSGIPDYFDEDVMDDYEDLWIKNPMYHMRKLKDFLPLFINQTMKYKVGDKFHYNNAGYILLGLIVEQASGLPFTDYIEEKVFRKANMNSSGYFELDCLPSNTALGYIDFPTGDWKTNIYSLPVKGGSDGGAFVTARDMASLWSALLHNGLLNEEYTAKLLTPYIHTNNQDSYYGYGVWIKKCNDEIFKYYIMGYDPGVSFHSAFYPKTSTTTVICSNKSEGAFDIMIGIENEILKQSD